jgi:hypothetical protein
VARGEPVLRVHSRNPVAPAALAFRLLEIA